MVSLPIKWRSTPGLASVPLSNRHASSVRAFSDAVACFSLLFHATIHLETPEEQNRAFSDAVLRIRDESLKEKNKTLDPADMKGLQELVKAKKDLEDLRRKRQQLHISFE